MYFQIKINIKNNYYYILKHLKINDEENKIT
jgi:hypothetical protein